MRILKQVAEHKLVFLETKDVVETTLALGKLIDEHQKSGQYY